jgi:hypothetical protein
LREVSGNVLISASVSVRPPSMRLRSTSGASAVTEMVSVSAPTPSGDAVAAERQQRRAVQPAFAGHDDAAVAGVEIVDGDGDTGQNGSRVVGDDAFDRAVDRGGLSRDGQGRGHAEEESQNQTEHGVRASKRGNSAVTAVYRAYLDAAGGRQVSDGDER